VEFVKDVFDEVILFDVFDDGSGEKYVTVVGRSFYIKQNNL